ncbi:hypothetical protein N665_0307s0030 [Sinapis alba]|nr:hypothetical protein N665_0307s0030 [Sinapis alba]
MRYNSWRIKDPSLLQRCALKQLRDICYAIALTRQAEAFFKQSGRLAREAYLSIQDVLNKAVDNGLVLRDYTITEIEPLVKVLHQEGFILDTDCPLTYSMNGTPSEGSVDSDSETVHPFKAPQIKVLTVGEDVEDGSMHFKILDELDEWPLTCSVLMFPSYKSKSKKRDEIYEPTTTEYEAYKMKMDKGIDCGLDLHTMLLTGDGIDRHGTHYLEFQDSLGDVGIGDRGFVRFAVEPNTVTECVLFKNFYNHDDD